MVSHDVGAVDDPRMRERLFVSELEETFAFHLKAKKMLGWLREHKFHPQRRWRLDFYHPAYNLAVEIEGGAWISGRHTRGAGFIADMLKYNAAAEMGIAVLRFDGGMVKSGEAIEQVERIINTKKQDAS